MSDEAHPTGRTCEWCGSPMDHDGRAVCPSCGRLASRLAAMEEPEAPVATAPVEPVVAPPARPGPRRPAPRPSAPRPAPPASSAPHAPSDADEPISSADGPVAPGGRWPAPAPLPPDDDAGRAWWKIAIPVVAVLALLGIAAAFATGGGRGGGSNPNAAPTAAEGTKKVDLSGVEDPAVTTTRPTTTTTEATATTVVTADGRYLTESASGIRWSMAAPPELGAADDGGDTWQAVDGRTTERVEIADLDGAEFDADAALAAAAKHFGAELDAIANSHIEDAPGRTASFEGTVDGKPMAGYVVAAQVGDQSLVMTMVKQGDGLENLYVEWLSLPSSVKLP